VQRSSRSGCATNAVAALIISHSLRLPCPRRASRSRVHRLTTDAATLSLHPTARTSTRPLFACKQDHRHGLRMDRLDHRVRRCRRNHRPDAGPAPASTSCHVQQRRPDASEGEQRSVIVEREPHHIVFHRHRGLAAGRVQQASIERMAGAAAVPVSPLGDFSRPLFSSDDNHRRGSSCFGSKLNPMPVTR